MLRLRPTQVLLKSKKASKGLQPKSKPEHKSKPTPSAKAAVRDSILPTPAEPTRSTLRPAQTPRAVKTPLVSARSQVPPKNAATTAPPQSRILQTIGKIGLFGGAIVIAGAGFYTAFVYSSYKRDARAAVARGIPDDVSDRYQRTAESFDENVDSCERYLGIDKLRQKLVAKATGHVLEVSVGTGRNMQYLPLLEGKIESVTMLDQSSEMIRMARKKWTDTNPWFIHTSFRVQSAASPIAKPNDEGFDTVIQTMGICSTPHPEAVLRNLARVCKKDGKILLLEHGKSHYKWLNSKLDEIAPGHADRHGCWFNKDIGQIIEDSGLEVVEAKRYDFGTTWWYELKPGKVIEEEQQSAVVRQTGEESLKKLWSWIQDEWKRRTS